MKDRKIILIVSIVSILLVITTCFAYFSAVVVNTNNEKLSTRAGTLSLKFDDNDNGVSGTLNLGESITKKFTLENTGTVDTYAKISWYNIVNTYSQNSLTWTLEQSISENGIYEELGSE